MPRKMFFNQQFLCLTVLAAVLGLGIYARFADLAWHFTCVDDLGVMKAILTAQGHWFSRFLAVSQTFTYAPLQFLITPLLVSSEQSYRELLFWGRLPSCIISVLSLFALTALFNVVEKKNRWAALIPVAVLAFSWQEITYAKQANNYAFGVLAVILLMVLLIKVLQKEGLTPKDYLISGTCLAILSYAQYQLLLFVAAFYITVFLKEIFSVKKRPLETIIGSFLSGAVYVLLILPMWLAFLQKQYAGNQGAPGHTCGLHNEFMFTSSEGASLLGQLKYAAVFFGNNLFISFQAHTAFVPADAALFSFWSVFLFALSIFGLVHCLVSKDKVRRHMFIFVFVFGCVWVYTVVSGKMNFAPSRHTMVLVPIMLYLVFEGGCLVSGIWAKQEASFKMFVSVCLLFIIVSWAAYFPRYRVERRDPFNEAEILSKLKEHTVTFTPEMVHNIELFGMRSVQKYIQENFFHPSGEHRSLAWISKKKTDFSPDQCEKIRLFYNLQFIELAKEVNQSPAFIRKNCGEFHLAFKKEIESDVQVDFTKRSPTEFNTNSLYFYIVQSD